MGTVEISKTKTTSRLDDTWRGVRMVVWGVCTMIALAAGGLIAALAFMALPIVGIYLFVGAFLFGLVWAFSAGLVGKAWHAWFGGARGRSRRAVSGS